MTGASAKLDKIAITLSVICLIHCLTLPLAITLLPILGTTLLSHEAFHQLMLIVVLPTSLGAFGIGCREHRQRSVAIVGGLGLALLVAAAFAVETRWGLQVERNITVLGGIVLAIAHIMNFNYCRHARCDGHHG